MNLRISPFNNFLRKTFLFLVVFSFTIAICNGQGKNASSFYTISYPHTLPKEVIDDIQYLLQLSTGQHWETKQDIPSNSGFLLSIKTEGNYKTGESCLVNSDGSTYTKFESPTTNGLIFGIYQYLRDLGFKFYLPDSLYTIIPALKSVFKKTSQMETPFMRIRDFFGTGGFGSGRTDPDLSVQKAWQLWKWRNGFGAEFNLEGHAGETFNLENAKELQKNPSWTATPIMKNGNLDESVKLNYYNNSAVDFFTDWAIKKYTDKNYKPSPAYLRDMVSIEPADGGGYLTRPPAGSNLKTISDQVFNAANVAAKKLDKLFPDRPNIGINLYAYSGHADVPSFALNPRVFVQIIPYQFQNIAFGPAFIKRWSQKVKRFGLYDYFKYPDSYWDLPGGYSIDELMKRAINAATAGSEGTTYESSYSKFSTAIPLWILCQYMCSGKTDWQKNYDQLIVDLYGKMAPTIKNLFNILYNQGQFGPTDINQMLNYIQEAQKLNTDAKILARINELKLYLCYVYMYLKSQDAETGNLEQRLLPLEKMAWTLYEKKIIHSYRIMQLVSYNFLNAKTTDKILEEHYHKLHLLTFPESDDPDALWKKDDRYKANELDKIFSEIYQYGKGITTSQTSASISENISAARNLYLPKENITLEGNYTVRGYFNLFCEKPATIIINWILTNSNNEKPNASISGTDNSYKAVYDYILTSGSGKISISLPAGESFFFVNAGVYTTYTLQLKLNNVFCYFNGSPRGKMSFLNEKTSYSYDPAYYPSYIYIPKNTIEVQYNVQVNALKIFNPVGDPVQTKLVSTSAGGDFEMRSFVVPKGLDGKFWKAVISGNFNYQFLNIPDRYFLLKEK